MRTAWNKGLTGEEFKKHYKNGMKGLLTGKQGIGNRFHKGQKSWNKGLKTNYSNRKGKSMEEIFGKEKSIEMIKKMSIAKKGRPAHNKGRPLTKEQKMKLSESLKGRKVWNTGMKFPKEEYPALGLRATRHRIIMPLKDTKIEIKIQNFLKELNIEYFTHQYMNIQESYQCDILIPSMNLIIECDGDYWHNYPFGNNKDKIRTAELIAKGFKVIRLWERDIKKMDLNKFKEIINE
jgi:very-short-patch-repair endonuclease